MSEQVCLIHLVWAPLGNGPLDAFAAAYRRHPADHPHRLLVVFNGFSDGGALRSSRERLDGVDHDELVLDRREHDLGAYRAAIDSSSDAVLAFVNSYAQPLTHGWLRTLVSVLERDEVGMVAATGSFESAASAAPRPLKPARALHYPRFPNAHLRTNAMAVERRTLDSVSWERPASKAAALRLESGRRGLSAQVRALGLRTLVVGRDGAGYDVEEWPASRTFRSADQENLLVADNRTRQYDEADPAERRRLAAMAWGDRGTV